MLYDPERNFLFLKTTKTAGSSIEYLLGPVLSERSLRTPIKTDYDRTVARVTWTSWREARNAYRAGLLPVAVLGRVDGRRLPPTPGTVLRDIWWRRGPVNLIGVGGFAREQPHMTASEVRARIGLEAFDRALKVAVIRHPYEHITSMYFHSRATDARHRDTPFGPWLEANQHLLTWNRRIVTIDGRCALDVVLRHEDLPGCLAEPLRRIGVDPGPILERLTTTRLLAESRPKAAAGSAAEVIDARSQALIDEVCWFEFELGGYRRGAPVS